MKVQLRVQQKWQSLSRRSNVLSGRSPRLACARYSADDAKLC